MAKEQDYSTAVNPNPTLAKYEDEIKALEAEIDPLGKEQDEAKDAGDRKRFGELETQIKPIREQLEEKRSQAREAGKGIRSKAGKKIWTSEGE